MSTATTVPRPDVTAEVDETTGGFQAKINVTRDGKTTTHEGGGTGYSRNGAVTEVVKKLLDDPKTAEWLP